MTNMVGFVANSTNRMTDGWQILENYLTKKINLELKLVELFLLSISAGIVIISLSEYKWIVAAVLLQIIALIWMIVIIVADTREKKTKESGEKLKDLVHFITVPFTWKELLPIIVYIISVIIMGAAIILPLICKTP